MFQTLKKFFGKKESKRSESFNSIDTIRFKDSILQDINVSIMPDGNSTVLCLVEKVNNYKIIVDQEKALLLSIIFSEYSKNNSFTNISKLFENTKSEEN